MPSTGAVRGFLWVASAAGLGVWKVAGCEVAQRVSPSGEPV